MPGFTSESNVTVAAPAEPAIASRAAAAPHVSALNVIFPPSIRCVECLLDCSDQCTDNAANWRCPKMGVFRGDAADRKRAPRCEGALSVLLEGLVAHALRTRA